MNILLTGATGFIGSHLARGLLKAGHDVSGIRRNSSSFSRLDDIKEHIRWFASDSQGIVDHAAYAGVDIVVLAAASYGRKGETAADIADANILKPLGLLEAAVGHGIRKAIYMDSALPRTSSPYSLSKGQFAQWGKILAEAWNIDFIDLRLEHVYGPGDDEIKFTCHVINACLRNQAEIELTAGTQRRDFIYVADVVEALIFLIKNMKKIRPGFVEVPLGTGVATSVRDLVELIHRLTNSSTRLEFGALPFKTNEVMHSCADMYFMKGLGWSPATDLRKGLELTIQASMQT